MSRIARVNDEMLEEMVNEFKETISEMKLTDSKVSYTKSLPTVDRKATLFFTEKAYFKMLSLVNEFSSEIGWYGNIKRGEDPEKDEYVCYDIIVYPQVVTGATVSIDDDEEYSSWMIEMMKEGNFDDVYLHGHSHVNMGVSASGTDLDHQEKVLATLNDDQFYVFIIWNKRNEKYLRIVDYEKNIVFETGDVTVKVLDSDIGTRSFIDVSKKRVHTSVASVKTNVKNKQVTTTNTENTTGQKVASKKKKKKKSTSTDVSTKIVHNNWGYYGAYGAYGYPWYDDDDDDYYNPEIDGVRKDM